MRYVRTSLALILLFAIIIRVSAAVVAPVLPTIAVAFLMAAVLTLLLDRRFR